jgi:hypothetical protein
MNTRSLRGPTAFGPREPEGSVATRSRDTVLGGAFLALGLVLPMLFHAVGLGSAFLPMFPPLLVAGFLLATPVALAVGVLTPLASALLTGMPPFYPPIAPLMMAEGLVLAAVPGLLFRRLRWGVWPSLAAAVAADRVVLLGAVLAASRWLHLPGDVLGPAAVIRGLPGIVIIFAVVPPLVRALSKRIDESPLFSAAFGDESGRRPPRPSPWADERPGARRVSPDLE